MALERTIRIIKLLIAGLLGVGLVSALVIKVPELHNSYIRNHVGKAVVKVIVGGGGGTGFHVQAPSGQTYIMTNEHVCSGKVGDILTVETDSGKSLQRRIVAVYSEHDLCLIEPLPNVKGLSLGSELSVGDSIGVVGHPILMPLTYSRGTVTSNLGVEIPEFNIEVSECSGEFIDLSGTMYMFFGLFTVCVRTYPALQTDYISYQGNSGSPAISTMGKVVGVHFAGRTDSISVGYIVPLKFVKHFLKDY